MKKIFMTLLCLITINLTYSQTETLLYYDRIESGNWAGGWWTPAATATTSTLYSTSGTTSAVLHGTGNNTYEADWYVLPNISGLDPNKKHKLKFRLASYQNAIESSTAGGVDGSDYINVQYSTDGGTNYTTELTVSGWSSAYWDYNNTTLSVTADGTNQTYGPISGGNNTASGYGISVIELTIPAGVTQLAFDIYATANRPGEEWWFDDFELYEVDLEPGDNPDIALPLTVNDAAGYVTYSNVGMTTTTGEVDPGCALFTENDIWFYVDVPSGITLIEFDTQTGSITDAGMAIYRGTPGSLTLIECDDDDALDGLMPYIYRDDLTPGERIYIRVWEYGGGTTGTFNIFASTPQALPVELTQFEAVEYPQWNVVKWTTASEQNSDYFSLERSEDGENWREIVIKKAAGNSNEELRYSHIDYSLSPLVYYRLKQVDINGEYEIYGPIVIHRNQEFKRVVKYINLAGQVVDPTKTSGIVIEIYDDGTIRKMIR